LEQLAPPGRTHPAEDAPIDLAEVAPREKADLGIEIAADLRVADAVGPVRVVVLSRERERVVVPLEAGRLRPRGPGLDQGVVADAPAPVDRVGSVLVRARVDREAAVAAPIDE